MNPCLVPVPKEDVCGDKRWESMHERYLAEAQTCEADVILIGDSIIQQLQLSPLWNDFSSLHCLNFGIGGDRVENVLWRLLDGELSLTTKIRVIVLFVGTNNTDCTAIEIFDGIVNLVTYIRRLLGNDVHILLPTLLPRGQFPNANRDRLATVNQLLQRTFGQSTKTDQLPNVDVIEIDGDLLQIDGTISHHIMHDYLHLTNEGYRRTFGKVYNKLTAILNCKENH